MKRLYFGMILKWHEVHLFSIVLHVEGGSARCLCWGLHPENSKPEKPEPRSEDHVKMQRPQMRSATAAGEMKRRVMQQSPRCQTDMMARHFTAGRCADALIPVLGLDALTPATPFKCSLLDTLDTSPTSSSTTSSSTHSCGPVPLLFEDYVHRGTKTTVVPSPWPFVATPSPR
jgi:hypothetical protein